MSLALDVRNLGRCDEGNCTLDDGDEVVCRSCHDAAVKRARDEGYADGKSDGQAEVSSGD